MKNRYIYYLQRIRSLGLQETFKRIKNRCAKTFFTLRWKQKTLSQKEKLHKNFLVSEKPYDIAEKILTHPLFLKHLPFDHLHKPSIIRLAENIKNNCFDLLGSKMVCFPEKEFPWHFDWKKNSLPRFSWRNSFYSDIKIAQKKNLSLDEYESDIKVPWELSRFQQIFVLGKAYQETKDRSYLDAFVSQVESWIKQNKFLIGANWVCPMDVAVRAINFIWGFHFFKDAPIEKTFWNTFLSSLYQHAYYLEHNWEESDKPNNHYISDLVGHLYLTAFFKNVPGFKRKRKKTLVKIIGEFERQVLPDGTCYEGSTSYHKLTAELFLHAYLICDIEQLSLPKTFKPKLDRMFLFLDACTINEKEIVQVGDNDSGKIVTGLRLSEAEKILNTISHYKDFGLTIIQQNGFHITFRHPTYSSQQPTGHFHSDALGVTLAYNGIPILVDPGTYLYTANTTWRNLFRSSSFHNTIQWEEQKHHDLFQMQKKACVDTAKITLKERGPNKKNVAIENTYKQIKRQLIFDQSSSVAIKDFVPFPERHIWNFHFHPEISLIKKDQLTWSVLHRHQLIGHIKTTLDCKKIDGHYSSGYGKIEPTIRLRAQKDPSKNSKEPTPILFQFTLQED
jgi:hypothetical protein